MQIASNTDKKAEYYLTSSEIASLPTTEVPLGSKAYVVDTSAEYTFYNGQWYEKNAATEANNG